ncbi:MAG: nucleotidyltransferase domain-containing protein [Methanocorpusculum sp.]|nr:nucleotidyltransferase domain-containing protein [Methanocorpusculum sp.]
MSETYVSIKDDVLKKLETNLPTILESFGVDTIGIFGSVSRGEDSPSSDVDVLYHFLDGRGGMYDLVGLHDYLVSLFDREVDLVSIEFISPLIINYIKSDALLFGAAQAIV